MPRPIAAGDNLATNKRMAAYLANQVYEMELAGEKNYRIWAYRKAAWALDDLEQDVELIYEHMGLKGLESIPRVGKSLAKKLEEWL